MSRHTTEADPAEGSSLASEKARCLTPAEYGAQIAANWPPLTDEQVEAAARILATVETDVAA